MKAHRARTREGLARAVLRERVGWGGRAEGAGGHMPKKDERLPRSIQPLDLGLGVQLDRVVALVLVGDDVREPVRRALFERGKL